MCTDAISYDIGGRCRKVFVLCADDCMGQDPHRHAVSAGVKIVTSVTATGCYGPWGSVQCPSTDRLLCGPPPTSLVDKPRWQLDT